MGWELPITCIVFRRKMDCREREGKETISKELDKCSFFKNCASFDAKLSLLHPLAIIETTRTSYRL